MRRRRRPEDVKVKPYHRSEYGYAFATGSMSGAFWGRFESREEGDQFTMPELRKAWAAYRDGFLSDRELYDADDGPSWAELVFDQDMNPDEARAAIASNG